MSLMIKELWELNFQLNDFIIVYAQKCDNKFLNLKEGIKDLARAMIKTKLN